MRLECGLFSGRIIETKSIDVNGVPVGVVAGYIASWTPDAHDGRYGVRDQILKGAYTKSIQEHKARNNRQVRLKNQHYQIIGGFPIETVKEDNVGLYGVGHINLDTQLGREAYSLARQGVLVDFSVGHIVKQEKIEDGKRKIIEAELFEGSIVDEPKNQRARITEVKSVSSNLDIIDDQSYTWNEDAARARVMDMKYADGNAADAFVGGHLIADFIDGKLRVIPEALRIAAREVKSRNDQLTIERYFAKLGEASPFEEKMFYTLDDVKGLSRMELKEIFTASGIFSNGAVRAIVARMSDDVSSHDDAELSNLIENIRSAARNLKNK